ncbi:MAG: 6-carboxytetrahydropterin synthase [Alphaproteobacteria bacterium]
MTKKLAPIVRLVKRVTFAAAHRLYNPELGDEENTRLYGKCSNPGGHGHNYVLEVTIEGETDARTGMVVNFTQLDELIRTKVLDRFDHKNLNTDVDVMHGVIPTVENIAAIIYYCLKLPIERGPARLIEVKVAETESNSAVYRGQGAEQDQCKS